MCVLSFVNVFSGNSYMEKSSVHPVPGSVDRGDYFTMACANSTASFMDRIKHRCHYYCFIFLYPLFFNRYKLSVVGGLAVTVLFLALGGLLSWYKNIQHDKEWFGKKYNNESSLVVTLLENPVEKTKSYKANASVEFILKNDTWIKSKGTIILYFRKDSSLPALVYGSQLVIAKPLQEIRNAGNPGGFDYKRYSLFQGITHQVYLKENEFAILPTTNKSFFRQFINDRRLCTR